MRYTEPSVIIPELEQVIGKQRCKAWSEEELEAIWKYYGSVETDILAKTLSEKYGKHRSAACCRNMAHTIGARKENADERYQGKATRKVRE